jgi:hypothetical protein
MKEGTKLDGGKSRLDLMVPEWELEVGKVLEFGCRKYADNNWQKVKGAEERYYAAARRHMLAYKMGEKNDPESGLSHIAHASCCLMFLHWLTKGDREIEENSRKAKDEIKKMADDAKINIEHDWCKAWL